MKLTVGGWCDRIPGILNSVNLSWQKDYPWEISIDSLEGGLDQHMVVLPHVLDVSVEFTPVHNFLPQKSIHAPFILPHQDNRTVIPEQQYYKPGIAESAADALELGVERLGGSIIDSGATTLPPNNRSDNSTTGEDGKKSKLGNFFNDVKSKGETFLNNFRI